MTVIKVARAKLGQVVPVLDDIRPADLREWYAASGRYFFECLPDAFQSDICRVALDPSGKPLCFWGGSSGQLWLFATNAAERQALSLHKVLVPNLRELEVAWPVLTALADARNVVHHRWLRWLGFEALSELPFGPFGLPFIMFVKET